MANGKQTGSNYEVGKNKPPVQTRFSSENQPEKRGRPKGSLDIMTMVQKLLEEPDQLPEALKKTIRERCGMDKRAVEAVFMSLLLEALQGDSKAAKELLDRGYGKVADKVIGDPDNPVQTKITFAWEPPSKD